MGKVKEELMNQEELRQELDFECAEKLMDMQQKHRLERYELVAKVNELLSNAKCNLMSLDTIVYTAQGIADLYDIQMALNEIEGLINDTTK